MSRRERRALPAAPTMDLRADLSSMPLCLQCEPQVLVEVDQFSGGLWQNVVHEHGCPEYAALQRQQARKAVNHGH